MGWSFVVALILCAFPIYQKAVLQMPIFYANGVDESSYLQYDYSRYVTEYAGVGRASQHLVNTLHKLGFSGGEINLLLDLSTVTGLLLLLAGVFQRAGCSVAQARLGALFTVVLPLVVSALNPIVGHLFQAIEYSNARYWVVLPPFGEFLALRSPEPQCSLVLALAAITIGQRYKAVLPVVCVLPFLYVFIAVPLAIGVVAWVAQTRFRWPTYGAWGVGFVGVGGVLYLLSFLMHEEVRRFTGSGHWPVVPVASAAAYLLASCIRSVECRKVIHLGSVATILAVNVQLIAGWFIQPSNYDQYCGLLLLCGALSVVLVERVSVPMLGFGALAAYCTAAVVLFVDAHRVVSPVLNERAVLESSPRFLAVRSLRLASWMNLVKSRQEPTLLSVTGGYGRLIDRFGEEFRCARNVLKSERELDPELSDAFRTLDAIYGTNNSDYFRNHLGRPTEPPVRLPLQPEVPERCLPKSQIVLR
jgi:hypothetical protein